MFELINKIHQHSFVRYFIMAVIIVLIELLVFQCQIFMSINYLLATVSSMAVGVVLNWIYSGKYVFRTSRFSRHTEFWLVVASSLVGIGIQVIIVYISVDLLLQIPIVGKIAGIGITFFWNYFVRLKFIFRK